MGRKGECSIGGGAEGAAAVTARWIGEGELSVGSAVAPKAQRRILHVREEGNTVGSGTEGAVAHNINLIKIGFKIDCTG